MLRGATHRRLARRVASARAPPRRLFGAKTPLQKKDGAAGGGKSRPPAMSAPPPPAQQAPHEAGGPGIGSLAIGLLAVSGGGVLAVRFNESANRFARESLPGLYGAVNQVIPLDAGSTEDAPAHAESEDAGEGVQGAAEPAAATIQELEERASEHEASAAEGQEQDGAPVDDAATLAEAQAQAEALVEGEAQAQADSEEVPEAEKASEGGAEEEEVEGTPIDVGGDAGDVEARRDLPEDTDPKFTGAGLGSEITYEVERLRVQALRETAERTQDFLRREMDLSVQRDLASLDEEALRSRVVELSRQLHDLSRLEGVRLNEALRQQEERLAERYMALLRAQAAAAQERMRTVEQHIHKEAEEALNREVARRGEALNKEAAELVRMREAELKAQLEEQEHQAREAGHLEAAKEFTHRLDDAAREFAERDGQRQKSLSKLRTEIDALSSVFGWHNDYERFSHEVHRVSLASLAIAQALETTQPLGPALVYLRAAARQDTTLMAVLRSMPREAELRGVQTRTKLATRFNSVKTRVRSSIYSHPDAGVLGRAMGRATVALLAEPEPEREALDSLYEPLAEPVNTGALGVSPSTMLATSPAQGEEEEQQAEEEGEPSQQQQEASSAAVTAGMALVASDEQQQQQKNVDDAKASKRARMSFRWEQEQRIAHAGAFLESGDLHAAVRVLNGLQGQARETLNPWLHDAKTRLAVEQALRVVRAHATTLAASLN